MKSLLTFRGGCLQVVALALLFCGALLRAQTSTQQVPGGSAATPASAATAPGQIPAPVSRLLIGAGDLLHITLLGAPEFEQEARVSDTGVVSCPMIGEVAVAGLAVNDAQKMIERRLREGGFYVDPQVSILVREYATQGISVLGEVQKPGIYPLLGAHTLFDAISAAGGTTAKAGRTVSITHRAAPHDPEKVILSYSGDDASGGNVAVLPGDTVVVSKAGMVYVVGDVRQPAAIVLENPNLTVLQAIAMAQGTNPTAALNKTRLLRRAGQGVQEIPVPLKKILATKAADIPLQAEDVLFVPNSLAKGAGMRTLDAALRTLSGVIVYGSRPY